MRETKKAGSIDEYIEGFPPEIQLKLEEIRAIIRKAAPLAFEKISYSMPAFAQNGVLVYFAAHKNHIGFYPTSSPVNVFKKELSGYLWSKGAIRFPLDKPIPYDLVSRIVSFRVNENMEKTEAKKSAMKAL
jgi:uncharacterized protein YdhG (YjbR/CyaY superfamily)